MARHHSLRASDTDRDAVVDRLRVAAGEGRLEPEELEERVGRALRARTYGELAKLVADLPRDHVRRPGSRRHWVARSAAVGAGVVALAVVAVLLVALAAILMVATAAWWLAVVLFWVACCGSKRRLAWGHDRRRSMRARHARPSAYF